MRTSRARPRSFEIYATPIGPAAAAALTKTRLRELLRDAGRQRGIDADVDRLHTIFHADYWHQPARVEHARGQRAAALQQLDAVCQAVDELAQATETAFDEPSDAAIINSFPGLGRPDAARVLAEIGDDRTRFTDARALTVYAGLTA